MAGCTVSIPSGVYFEVPRDYAVYCGGTLVRVSEGGAPDETMGVTWSNQWLCFSCNGKVVEYKRDAVFGLMLNRQEQVMGTTCCTVRAVFRGADGTIGSLVILSCSAQNHATIEAVFRELESCRLPVPIVDGTQWARASRTGAKTDVMGLFGEIPPPASPSQP
jgi:hypothetical protein